MSKDAESIARKDERINLRVDAKTKAMLVKAAEICGTPLSEFVIQTALDRADRLVSQPKATRVSTEEFFRVLDLIETPPEPTDHLVDAMQRLS